MVDSPKTSQPAHLYRLPPRDRAFSVTDGHDCVVALRALGEDTRVRIIGLLIDVPLDVGEISKRVGVSPYNVSKHLRILREAGLLEVKKTGRRHLYALPDAIRRRVTEGSVLDLGCCSFQFDPPAPETRTPMTQHRRKRTSSHVSRAAR
jgi:DNA-binding transcriptional ArsR family regulator